MINIHYFANIRESLGVAREQMPVTAEATVTSLIDALSHKHGKRWQAILQDSKVLVAVNQVVVPMSTALTDGDEVAFFPPVTGG